MVRELTPPRGSQYFFQGGQRKRPGWGWADNRILISGNRQKKKSPPSCIQSDIKDQTTQQHFIPAGVEPPSFQHIHPPAEFSCNAEIMAKSARSSQIKANNRRLKKNVFGPIEAARNERLSAKLQELIAQPKPEREVEVEMEAVDEGMLLVSWLFVRGLMLMCSQNLQQSPRAKMPLKRQNVSALFAPDATLDATDVSQPWRWMVTRRPRHLRPRRGLRSGGEARSRGLCSPSMARSAFPRRNEDAMDGLHL